MSEDYRNGMRRAAEIAKMFADENFRMATDTILLDPIINRKKRAQIRTYDDLQKATALAESLEVDGCIYSARAHSAKDIAQSILSEIGEEWDE